MVDPMNLSGLALSTLTLPAQLFSSGVVAYTTISQVKGMGITFNKHNCHFKIWESRYIYWGMCHNACNPGGLAENQMPPIIYNTLVNTLIQINDILIDRNNLVAKYGLQDTGQEGQMEPSSIRRESMRQQNVVKRLQKCSSLIRKVGWAVRDEGRFGGMVADLSGHIRTLYEILPVPGGALVEDTISAQTVSDLVLSGSAVAVLQGLQQIPGQELELQIVEARNSASRRVEIEGTSIVPHQPAQQAPSSRLLDIQQLSFPSQDLPYVPTMGLSGLRSWARTRQSNPFSKPEAVLVEWLRYDLQRDRTTVTIVKSAFKTRIEALVMMLEAKPRSDSFRVLECVGYVEDNTDSRFGLTFRLPSYYNQLEEPVPQTLFDTINKHPYNIPYLGDRFRLAYLLSESVHSLLAAGWLHKSINSHNILLSPRTKQPHIENLQTPVSLEDPYFTGFALSRPDDPHVDSSRSAVAQKAMAMYRHPEVNNIEGRQSVHYRAIHDIYSLGTLLVEIATWRTLARYYPSHPAPNFNFRQVLLEKVVPGLGVSMGERYMTVVRKCLEGNFERLEGYREDEYGNMDYKDNVRQGLLWEVVAVLRDCRA